MRCLSEFAVRGVNLTKIESRPRRGRLGHYLFLADVDGRIATGIKVHQSDTELVLRDADDRELALPLDAIDEQKPGEGRHYVSQRAKLEDFLDAEYGEEVLAVVQRAINELV